MPALPPVPNVCRCVLKGGLNADLDVINHFYVQFTGGSPTNSNLDDVALAMKNSWVANLAPNMHVDFTLLETTVTDLTSPTSAFGSWSGTEGGTGASGAILGAGSAVRINRQIFRRYRGGHPGVFLPLTSSAYLVDPQTITGAYIAAIQTAWTNLEADTGADMVARWATTTVSVSVSYYQGFDVFTTPSGRTRNIPKLRVGGPLVDHLTNIEVNPRVASQRRRNLTRS